MRGVKEVQVNLFRARAVIVHDACCTVDSLIAAIAQAGDAATISS